MLVIFLSHFLPHVREPNRTCQFPVISFLSNFTPAFNFSNVAHVGLEKIAAAAAAAEAVEKFILSLIKAHEHMPAHFRTSPSAVF